MFEIQMISNIQMKMETKQEASFTPAPESGRDTILWGAVSREVGKGLGETMGGDPGECQCFTNRKVTGREDRTR